MTLKSISHQHFWKTIVNRQPMESEGQNNVMRHKPSEGQSGFNVGTIIVLQKVWCPIAAFSLSPAASAAWSPSKFFLVIDSVRLHHVHARIASVIAMVLILGYRAVCKCCLPLLRQRRLRTTAPQTQRFPTAVPSTTKRIPSTNFHETSNTYSKTFAAWNLTRASPNISWAARAAFLTVKRGRSKIGIFTTVASATFGTCGISPIAD